MPTKVVAAWYTEQDGTSDQGTSAPFDSAIIGAVMAPGLTMLGRSEGVDIPPGSVITDARFKFHMTQKDAAVAGTVTFQIALHDAANSADLVPGVYEDTRARTAATQFTITWNTAGGSPQQFTSPNIASAVQSILDKAGWNRFNAMTWILDVVSESSELNLELGGTQFGGAPFIEVTYTEPEVVQKVTANLALNPSMEIDLARWESYPVMGVYDQGAPTLSRTNARARFGLYSLLATWPTAAKSWVNHWGMPLQVGLSYYVSVWVYVPSGSPDVAIDAFGQGLSAKTSVKDAWVQLSMSFVANAGSAFIGVYAENTTAGQQLYLDGFQIVPGGETPPYFDGDTLDYDYYTFTWNSNQHNSISKRFDSAPPDTSNVNYHASGSWQKGERYVKHNDQWIVHFSEKL